MESSRRERRRHPRVDVAVEITLTWSGASEPAVLRDVSQGGCFVATGAPIAELATVALACQRADGTRCAGTGVVVRRDPGGFGVRFSSTNEQLKDFVHALGTASESRWPALLAEAEALEVTIV